jgi:hypothetical protein
VTEAFRRRRSSFLFGSPWISTCWDAGSLDARFHILGVTRGCEMLAWGVEPFVVGDKAPRRWVSAGSEQGLRRTLLRALDAHLIRAGLRAVNVRRAWRELGGGMGTPHP